MIRKRKLNCEISENDKMLKSADEAGREHYFYVSDSAMKCIFAALEMAGKTEVNSILDMPCGHGRVLRRLRADFPKAEIVACDLEKDAVEFCVNTFGVQGVYSDIDVSRIAIDKTFDLIWCGSLLTHLYSEKSKQFFDFFVEHLNPDGLLVLSFHGRYAMNYYASSMQSKEEIHDAFKKFCYSDYAFFPGAYQIDGDYTIPEYGGAFQKMDWVISLVQSRDDITLTYYSESRWNHHQDILAIQKKNVFDRHPRHP